MKSEDVTKELVESEVSNGNDSTGLQLRRDGTTILTEQPEDLISKETPGVLMRNEVTEEDIIYAETHVSEDEIEEVHRVFQEIEAQKNIIREEVAALWDTHEGKPVTYDTSIPVADAVEDYRQRILGLHSVRDLSSSDEIILAGMGVREYVDNTYKNIESEILSKEKSLDTAYNALKEANAKKGFRKLFTNYQRPKLEQKKDELISELAKLRAERDGLYSTQLAIHRYVQEAVEHKESLIDEVITEKLKPIEGEYERLVNVVAENEGFSIEVKRAIITDFIEKRLQNITLDLPADQSEEEVKSKFIGDLKQYVALPVEARTAKNKTFESSPVLHSYNTDITSPLNEIIAETNIKVALRGFVNNVAYQDLTGFRQELRSRGGQRKNIPAGTVDYVGRKAQFYRFHVGPNPVMLWQAVKNSPGIQAAFGERVSATDEQIYRDSLDRSYTDNDGFYIDCLEHYPTPDALRTVVLLASAEHYGHRTQHANRVLSKYAKDKDFLGRMDAAIAVYPQLAKVREKLLTWNRFTDSNDKELTSLTFDLAEDVLDTPSLDSRLIKLAQEVLPTSALTQRLVAQGKLNQELVDTYESAAEVLIEAKKKTDLPYIDSEIFNRNIRFHVLNASADNLDKKMFDRMKQLSELIITYKDDPQTLAYLTDRITFEAISVKADIGSINSIQNITRLIAQNYPTNFITSADRTRWKELMGERTFTAFLNALPKAGDEKRNAFTHNPYDRTTLFIEAMIVNSKGDFTLTEKDFDVMTHYVEEFGLAKIPELYHYYKHIYLKNQNEKYILPRDIEESGVTTFAELHEGLKVVRALAYSETPLTNISELPQFQRDMLKFITGKSTHRFDTGRPEFEQIIADYERNNAEKNTVELPEGYKTEVIELQRTQIEFDPEPVRQHYEVLKGEILESLSNGTYFGGLVKEARSVLEAKTKEIESMIEQFTANGETKKIDYAARDLQRYQGYIADLGECKSTEQILQKLLSYKIDKNEQPAVNSILRRCIFQNIFPKSSAYMGELQPLLAGDISAEAILKIANMIKDPIQEHMMNLKAEDLSNYWSQETIAVLKTYGKKLGDIFNPHMKALRETVKQFEVQEMEGKNIISAIPDRGFIGEMSGYLADVCYTKEYPLLAREDLIVPYKFVTKDRDTGEPKFVGSVLVFEIEGEGGIPALMIRGFDVPQETEYNIPDFIEQFLDRMTVVAKQRGKEAIYIPGDDGAISNYRLTIAHMRSFYTRDRGVAHLTKQFSFNGYDLTNNSYVARTIEK